QAPVDPAAQPTPVSTPVPSIDDGGKPSQTPRGNAPASRNEEPRSVDEAGVRAAGDLLGIARKTLLKLLAPARLLDLRAEADRLGADDAERARRLRAAAADALLAMLQEQDFNQTSVASTLGASRTTLIKLMDDLGLPRAADLGASAIEQARARAGGDLDAAARLLRDSPSALKKRATQLGIK